MAISRRRARNPQDKEARRQAIMDVAIEALSQRPYHDISVVYLAEQLELSKSTLYLYFPTKEALYTDIIIEHHQQWSLSVEDALLDQVAPTPPHVVAALLTATLLENNPLAHLLTLLHQDIEHALSVEQAMNLRRRLRDDLLPLSEHLERLLPSLVMGDGFRFLICAHALVCGLWPLAHPAPNVKRTLDALDLSMFRMDFAGELHRALVHMLQGWGEGPKQEASP